MEKELTEMINQLKEESEEKHNQGVGFEGVSEGLSEFYHGYSEGLDLAIERIEAWIKYSNQRKQVD